MLDIIRDVLSRDVWQTSFAATCLGVLFHLAIRNVEVDYRIWRLIGLYAVLLTALDILYSSICSFGPGKSILRTVIVSLAFNTGLTLSIGTYRLFLHRLKNFPGPVPAKLSRFYAMSLAAKNIQYHLEVEKLHKSYGDFVRTGPREISITRASAVLALYGPQTECRKSTWYSQVSDDVAKCSLNSSRDFEDHKRRKRAWDQGFSMKALNVYEPRIRSKVDILLSQMKARAGSPVNMTEWSMFFTFDTMGAVGFGKEFRMLDNASEHSAIKALHDQMTVLGLLTGVPWLLSMLASIPGAAGGYAPFTEWCGKQAKSKEKTFDPEKDPSDIFSWLLKATAENDQSAPPGPGALAEDSRLIIIAGSDTTAATLANAFYYLVKYPEIYRKLQSILDCICPRGEEDWSYDKVKALPYLDGIINETLRLKPAVPSGVPRVTPKAGLQIDEMYIPGDTIVVVPTYSIQRDARYFENPSRFIPERWAEDEMQLMMEKSAYAPFSLGVYGCVGKNFALMQLRTVISRIALNFDLSFAPGENGIAFDSKAMDTFTLTLPSLEIVFRERAKM